MLETLSLQNFQCHEDLRIEFGPGVTTIVGPTDRGKSAVLRALRWLCLSTPSGEAFVRDGARETVVTLEIDDVSIERRKGLKSLYRLGGKEFAAFGSSVPPEIAGHLGAGAVTFQTQHEGPFWFAETAGEVGRQLNTVVDLGLIDSTLAALDRECRSAAARVEVGEERVKAAKLSRTATAGVDEQDAALRAVEGLESQWHLLRDNCARIDSLAHEVSGYGGRVERALNRKETALAAVRAGERLRRLEERRDRLQELVRQITQLQAKAAEARGRVREARVSIQARMGKRCPLCQKAL